MSLLGQLFGNNAGDILNMLTGGQSAEQKQLASKAGVTSADFSKIAAVGLPLLLQSINKNNKSENELESFTNALRKDHQVPKSPAETFNLDAVTDTADGEKILGHVFQETSSVFDRVGQTVGVDGSTVKKVLVILAPLVLKYLADRSNNAQDPVTVREETKKATQEVTERIQKQSEGSGNDMGLLGSLIDMFDGSDESVKGEEGGKGTDYGLLGKLFGSFTNK